MVGKERERERGGKRYIILFFIIIILVYSNQQSCVSDEKVIVSLNEREDECEDGDGADIFEHESLFLVRSCCSGNVPNCMKFARTVTISQKVGRMAGFRSKHLSAISTSVGGQSPFKEGFSPLLISLIKPVSSHTQKERQ